MTARRTTTKKETTVAAEEIPFTVESVGPDANLVPEKLVGMLKDAIGGLADNSRIRVPAKVFDGFGAADLAAALRKAGATATVRKVRNGDAVITPAAK